MTNDRSEDIQHFLQSVGSGEPVAVLAKIAFDDLLKDNEIKIRMAIQAMIMWKICRMAKLIGMIDRADTIFSRDGGMRLEFMSDKDLINFHREVTSQYDSTIKLVNEHSSVATTGGEAVGDSVTNILVNVGDSSKVLTREEELKQVQVRSTVRKVIGGLLDQVEEMRRKKETSGRDDVT